MIVRTFLTKEKIVPDESMLSINRDAQFTTVFADKARAKAFVEHHQCVSEGMLRVVDARANSAAGPRHRIHNAKCPLNLE